MAAVPDVELTIDNAILQLTKHGFPPGKWSELAMHLHVEQRDLLPKIGESHAQEPSRELAELIAHWISRDSEKSWRLLVDSVIRCNEMMVAKRIAQEVGVPFPGAHHQTPTKPPAQQTPQQTPTNPLAQQTPSKPPAQQHSLQPEGGSTAAGARQRITPVGGSGGMAAGLSGGHRQQRGMLLMCLPWRSCGVATALGLVGIPVYLYSGKPHLAGGIWSGAAVFALLEFLFHLRGIKTRSRCVEVSGVKVPHHLFSLAGGIGAGCVYWYLHQ